MCRRPWPPYIINNLILAINPEGQLTNSNIEITALILHKATLPTAVTEERMAAPRSGSYNIPTVSWSTRKAFTINLVVDDFLYIHTLYSRQFFLNPPVFCHLGQENCMTYDASHLFGLPDTSFLAHVSVAVPQPLSLGHFFPLPLELFSCVMYKLRRKPCKRALLRMQDSRGCTSSGRAYAPPCQSILIFKIQVYGHWFRYTHYSKHRLDQLVK